MSLELKGAPINEEKSQEMCIIHHLYPISFPNWRKGCEGQKTNVWFFYQALLKLVSYTETHVKVH